MGKSTAVPGPGAYRPGFGGGGPMFSCTPRRKTEAREVKDDGPGPGAYVTNQNTALGPQHQFGSGERKPENESRFGGPGPGAYTPQAAKQGPQYAFGNSQRPDLQRASEYDPDPNSDVTLPSKLVGGPQWTIGSRPERPQRRAPGPGPADYSLRSTVGSGQSRSFGGKTGSNRQGDPEIPGPGTYGDYAPQTDRGCKFASGARDNASKQIGPGPGAYSPRVGSGGIQRSFGSAKRRALSTGTDAPGPGSYSIPSAMGAKGLTAAGKPEARRPETAPGPGSYDPSLKHVADKSPGWKLGRSKRAGLMGGRGGPGPGTYGAPSTLATSGPTMKGRHVDGGQRDVPGPGAHGEVYSTFGR
mmetsp:Transcript_6537/g.16107  ORF Transcript_6537/g.16107 Transcript_6537/m.16107 type:complete len:357 (-) Transcript_6537:152-1222(-)